MIAPLRLVALLSVAAASTRDEPAGFLFVANEGAFMGKGALGDLEEALRGACATGHPVRLVVDTPADAAAARPPCDGIDVVVLRADPRVGGAATFRDGIEANATGTDRQRHAFLALMRRFKLEAIAAGLDAAFPGGTVYLDNDVSVRAGASASEALFAVFDVMRRAKKAVGIAEAPMCLGRGAAHRDDMIPDDFCERNSGVVFFGDAETSRSLVADWLAEFEARPSRDGHDQQALRRVLWRRRDELYDVPGGIQCRGLRLDEAGVRRPKRRSCDPCERDAAGHRPLLWHDHQPTLRENAARHALLSNGSLCGFAVAAPPGRPGSG